MENLKQWAMFVVMMMQKDIDGINTVINNE